MPQKCFTQTKFSYFTFTKICNEYNSCKILHLPLKHVQTKISKIIEKLVYKIRSGYNINNLQPKNRLLILNANLSPFVINIFEWQS